MKWRKKIPSNTAQAFILTSSNEITNKNLLNHLPRLPKNTTVQERECGSVVDCFPSVYEALGLNCNSKKINRLYTYKERERVCVRERERDRHHV